MHTTLIDADILAACLNDPNWVIIDCRFRLNDTEAGRRAWAAGHIPGAVYAHLNEDLSSAPTSASGRHPLPDLDSLARTFSAWGISADTQVVAYDDVGGGIAARLWWLLRYMGHAAVAVLNGGWQAWEPGGYPTSSAHAQPVPAKFNGVPQPGRLVDAEDVERLRQQHGWVLVDARAPVRYRGEQEPVDPIAGRIPGAVNHFWKHNLGDDGKLLPADSLRTRLLQTLGDVTPDHSVFYCGSGVTACHDLLAMEVAGLSGARLYPGSWSEWLRDSSRPVAGRDQEPERWGEEVME